MFATTSHLSYSSLAPAKSGVPDWSLVYTEGDNARAKACFLLSKYLHAFNGGLVVELLTKRRKPSVPVRPIRNQLTTNRLVSICGGLMPLQKEIAAMAICAQNHLKTYLFAAVKRSNPNSSHPVMLRISAASERLARLTACRQYVLSFAGVIQNGGAN